MCQFPQGRKTLLIRLRATIDEELAISDEVLHGLNNITLNGHFLALVCELFIAKPRIGLCQNESKSFSFSLFSTAFPLSIRLYILPVSIVIILLPSSFLQQIYHSGDAVSLSTSKRERTGSRIPIR